MINNLAFEDRATKELCAMPLIEEKSAGDRHDSTFWRWAEETLLVGKTEDFQSLLAALAEIFPQRLLDAGKQLVHAKTAGVGERRH